MDDVQETHIDEDEISKEDAISKEDFNPSDNLLDLLADLGLSEIVVLMDSHGILYK